MKIKDLLEIINQNKWYKKRIKFYKSIIGTKNIGEVLQHNYEKWLNTDISEVINEQ